MTIFCLHSASSYSITQTTGVHKLPFCAVPPIICSRLVCPTAKPRSQEWGWENNPALCFRKQHQRKSSGGTGSMHCVDTSEPNAPAERACAVPLAHWTWEMAASETRLQDCSKHTTQNKTKGPHSNKTFVLSGKSGKSTFLDRAVVRPSTQLGCLDGTYWCLII